MDNKIYRIVNVLGGFKNGKKITDHNPLANYHALDNAKRGLKEFYKNYIDTLDADYRKEVSAFWAADENEVIVNYQGKQICRSTIYEVEYIMSGNPVTESIVKYRDCTVKHIDGTVSLWKITSTDNINVSCKSTVSEALNFIDWLALVLDEDDAE